ncbi:MAG: nuclear transport factor 2 family protein [Erythrobacter sp.]|nr:nuclear transport factor 2 family protein [Erythrobacter sp.]
MAIQSHLVEYCMLVDTAEPAEIADLFWKNAQLGFGWSARTPKDAQPAVRYRC